VKHIKETWLAKRMTSLCLFWPIAHLSRMKTWKCSGATEHQLRETRSSSYIPGVANQSRDQEPHFLYHVAAKRHIIHMSTHEHHLVPCSLIHIPLLSKIYCKYHTPPTWQWQNSASHLLLCMLLSGTSGNYVRATGWSLLSYTLRFLKYKIKRIGWTSVSSLQGCGLGVAKSRRLLGGVGFLRTLGIEAGFFLSDSDNPIEYFFTPHS